MWSTPRADARHLCKAAPAGAWAPGDRLRLSALVVFVSLLGAAIRFLPLRRVATLASQASRAARPARPRAERCLVALVDRACGRAWPAPTCLVRSLALDVLLQRHGYDSQVVIGVAPDGDRLSAHAWVETGAGRAVEGDGHECYRVLCRITAGGIHPVRQPGGARP